MKRKAFDSFHRGYSHVKNDSECEDYSISYNDPDECFYIAAISDGHSDKNCFRSSSGSRFACEAAKEVLIRFCETYLDEDMHFDDLNYSQKERLMKSIKQCWDNKVEQDLQDNPIKEDDLDGLSDRVKAYYGSGQGLENIYGATFLATAICNDLCIILHIGDGVILSISSDGNYVEPMAYDPKSETGEPSSICNNDLFSREFAFRCEFIKDIPQAVFLTSDGIGDSMDDISIREFFYNLLCKLEEKKEENSSDDLNEVQQAYLDSCVSYYAEKGHGVDDDCSIGGIYTEDSEIPLVSVSLDYAMELMKNAVDEHNVVIRDYEKRKGEAVQQIIQHEKIADEYLSKNDINSWMATHKKAEEIRQILKNIVKNEEEKKSSLVFKIDRCKKYVERAGGTFDELTLTEISPIDPAILEEDDDYLAVNNEFKAIKLESENLKKAEEEEDNAKKEMEEKEQRYNLISRKALEAESEKEQKELNEKAFKLKIVANEAKEEYENKKKNCENLKQNQKTHKKGLLSAINDLLTKKKN